MMKFTVAITSVITDGEGVDAVTSLKEAGCIFLKVVRGRSLLCNIRCYIYLNNKGRLDGDICCVCVCVCGFVRARSQKRRNVRI